uniref:BTB domain-containing protein n=1 Tax=Lotharella globosa TaxID=91324 RepID=A0A7S4DUQ1_9EUKA|mmetsp:Transcript_7941/g.14713  ORF Transcript_7941/g.14713 Transcript_7941/m.14713 type:complete len:642 (+) Transcript_7941:137-2062(+)|eukprot:CAMPEP_0167771478 /NCGR_PEP_ID=MMETSP0111_2-20121227/301_1 /TAXON_ID=91324 /ORGANISM="Lotharella globosa, Strain CCCM811" /LENGTH=641 /DNA_ID=CAMNT_0007660837 /DNA_START=933 /DNA_END=2858 /DNA_ORIENTATION=+
MSVLYEKLATGAGLFKRDVAFKLKDGSIVTAHRMILSCYPFFENMFKPSSLFMESKAAPNEPIPLPDADQGSMQVLKPCLYKAAMQYGDAGPPPFSASNFLMDLDLQLCKQDVLRALFLARVWDIGRWLDESLYAWVLKNMAEDSAMQLVSELRNLIPRWFDSDDNCRKFVKRLSNFNGARPLFQLLPQGNSIPNHLHVCLQEECVRTLEESTKRERFARDLSRCRDVQLRSSDVIQALAVKGPVQTDLRRAAATWLEMRLNSSLATEIVKKISENHKDVFWRSDQKQILSRFLDAVVQLTLRDVLPTNSSFPQKVRDIPPCLWKYGVSAVAEKCFSPSYRLIKKEFEASLHEIKAGGLSTEILCRYVVSKLTYAHHECFRADAVSCLVIMGQHFGSTIENLRTDERWNQIWYGRHTKIHSKRSCFCIDGIIKLDVKWDPSKALPTRLNKYSVSVHHMAVSTTMTIEFFSAERKIVPTKTLFLDRDHPPSELNPAIIMGPSSPGIRCAFKCNCIEALCALIKELPPDFQEDPHQILKLYPKKRLFNSVLKGKRPGELIDKGMFKNINRLCDLFLNGETKKKHESTASSSCSSSSSRGESLVCPVSNEQGGVTDVTKKRPLECRESGVPKQSALKRVKLESR